MILKGLAGGLFQLLLLGALLLIPAGLLPGGTWWWSRALVFLGAYGLLLLCSIVALALLAPDSLAARMRVPASKAQPFADRVVTAVMMVTFLAWFVFVPVDVFSLRLPPPPPPPVSASGAFVLVFGYAVCMAAVYQNSFAVPILEDQTDRGQILVDTGLYGIVRHPLYSGMLLFYAGVAMPGYTEYMRAVRYRMVPLVW